jgi:CDP-diacylglycerol---serine O-phosphatidyltransferase
MVKEGHVPRPPWRRRRVTDSPRPAGRRWTGRLRRSGRVAREVLLVRVTRRRHHEAPGTTTIVRPAGYLPDRLPPRTAERFPQRLAERLPEPDGYRMLDMDTLAPTSPAAPFQPSRAGGTWGPAGTPAAHGVPLTVPLLPGDHTAARRLAFMLVSSCTVASLLLGVGAILLAMQGDVHTAAVCLIGCVTFDGLDGALARRLGVASPFGAQMDSLADMCAFGIAAPVVFYASLAGSVSQAAAGVACALVAACSAIRLARFNVSPKDGRFFCGVPTTLAAAVLALAVLADLPVSGRVQLAMVALLAFAMVSTFPYVKLARLVKLPPWLWLVPVAGALVNARLTFAAAVIGYLVSGPLLWLRQRRD